MHRPLIVTLLGAGLLAGLAACDSLGDIVGDSDGDGVITTDQLRGSRLLFIPFEARGGVPEWEYYFTSSGSGDMVQGCNHEAQYTSTGWIVQGDDQVRVNFGAHWEEYTLERGSGSLADGDLSGTFEYEASVDLVPGGNDMEGTFLQLSRAKYCP